MINFDKIGRQDVKTLGDAFSWQFISVFCKIFSTQLLHLQQQIMKSSCLDIFLPNLFDS